MTFKHFSLVFLNFLVLTLVGCGGGVNLFTVEDDIQLGNQLEQEILSNPQEYPILPEADYPEAYAYLNAMGQAVLASEDVRYRNEFDWKFYIIDQDVLNAFAAPGGKLFFYTGLIKFLDRPSAFAGVVGHEIAHADQRHSTEQMTKLHGVQTLFAIVSGNEDPGLISNIAASLLSLRFSRNDETEADEFSVDYLCDTDYDGAGAADFFEKLEQQGQGGNIPEFLSTHPNPENRVENINSLAQSTGCDGPADTPAEIEAWQAFQNSLP